VLVNWAASIPDTWNEKNNKKNKIFKTIKINLFKRESGNLKQKYWIKRHYKKKELDFL